METALMRIYLHCLAQSELLFLVVFKRFLVLVM